MNTTHISPTPVGMRVYAEAEVINISANGKMVDFKVSAYDEMGLIGEGTHQRAVIDNDRFMEKPIENVRTKRTANRREIYSLRFLLCTRDRITFVA